MPFFVYIFILLFVQTGFSLPSGFVYLKDIAPDIEQDIRYASRQNFVGQIIDGYQKGQCILTRKAAKALNQVQKSARKLGYGLKVYDCYRPQRAVNAFYHWSQNSPPPTYDPAYYPRVKKSQLFQKGYIARYSGHSRGSTVDLTLIPLKKTQIKRQKTIQEKCFSSTSSYLNDNSIDMGTRFDCLDPSAHFRWPMQSKRQFVNRKLLRKLMHQAGFKPYDKEWWHFRLGTETFSKRYFDFLVK